jgi:hypothetical protein
VTDNDELQTSPLDLSTTSTRFKFVPRSKSTDNPPSSPMELSIDDSPIVSRQTSRDFYYDEPIIVTHPKSEWHYRSIKDLAKKHIPFISGDGPQRTPIRIKVSFDYFHKNLSSIKLFNM